jgi:hypothetical protein
MALVESIGAALWRRIAMYRMAWHRGSTLGRDSIYMLDAIGSPLAADARKYVMEELGYDPDTGKKLDVEEIFNEDT